MGDARADGPTVGWVGTGVMGGPMCGHVIDAGYSVVVHSRTPDRAGRLLDRGASWSDSPADLAAGCDVVVTMVGYPADVEAVYLGPAGILRAAQPGAVLVDCTTSSPDLAARIAHLAGEAGAWALDAPVSGGDIGARDGSLSIMVGGDREAFDRVLPLLELFGSTIVHQGPSGSGQHAKMVNQTLIASSMVGVCEALLYAHRAGLDPARVLQSVGGGAAASWALQHLAPRMLAGDTAAGFYVEHFIKDMGIALDEARRMDLDLPGLRLAHGLYERLAAMGHERSGTQALILALADLSEVVWSPVPPTD